MKISVIIPTLTPNQVKIPQFLQNQEIIIVNQPGRARARNIGALKASNSFLLFMDDDVHITEKTYLDYILKIFEEYPEAIVCKHHPILGTRVMGISKKLFLMLRGFDETMETGEDADFGFKAVLHNIKIFKIPRGLIPHREHSRPSRAYQLFIRTKNKLRYLLRYHKCWSNRGVDSVNLKSCLFLFAQSSKIGPVITVQFVTFLTGFFYYFFWDKQVLLRSVYEEI